ncbi:MAG TPA: A/G-specific adenine glycosylase, partial [Terriglobia bacterium]|nr:A/G-specific adenine glycosylase [Terriglobia bacterium]
MKSLSGKSRAHATRKALLKWYGVNARALPWRGTSDPYAVWVSEIMLQQTQVATVIPYYERFLRAFPTVELLARAPFERVAALWSGLGYYRRARHLHLAAQKISTDFGGRFPITYSEARTLPGVGHYTASAVLSIAYGKPFAVLDGNVARVVSRLYALNGNLQQPDFRA